MSHKAVVRHGFLWGVIGLLGFAFSACAGENFKEENPFPESSQADIIVQDKSGTDFLGVLASYQGMNDRLERVSAPLRLANVELCPKTFRDPGFTTHILDDYPERLRGMARDVLNLSPEAIYVRRVRPGSPAERADIQAGDQVVSLNGRVIPSGLTMDRFYAALSRDAFGGTKTRLTLKTPKGDHYDTSLQPQTACDYDASVFYSEEVNGHTDGEEIFISSGLMQFVPDDNSLAMIVAHEMGHAMAGHINQRPTAELELEADRMALVLMANAGYDIAVAINYWAKAVHPHRELQDNSESHPSIEARHENFQKEHVRILSLSERDETLGFQ